MIFRKANGQTQKPQQCRVRLLSLSTLLGTVLYESFFVAYIVIVHFHKIETNMFLWISVPRSLLPDESGLTQERRANRQKIRALREQWGALLEK